ncbi:MAG: thiamine pyrophosphate-dependent dehydrogenase E1 component subunit alpha [Smithellaceae bacterium]|nr:thiamine pyrophosphate-dependent dehydrogenase E1 component subunit alpha [Smithellaceae bacterium]
MEPDLFMLYRQMLRSRLFEEAVMELWNEGRISGEMHLAIGEEAICPGVCTQLRDGDALALDHRGTPPLVMRGVSLVLLLKEFLGSPDGLCRGWGGHMHLFAPERLTASSGIVGAAGPTAVGFALAHQHLRAGAVAVAFFGDGAANQGMLMEAMNLASAWKLPAIFVCKDNQWAITTRSASVTGGDLVARAASFGMPAVEVDGMDAVAVWKTAATAIARARTGEGPSFIKGCCLRSEGHFLGDPLVRVARHPISEITEIAPPLIKAVGKFSGTTLAARAESLMKITELIGTTVKEQYLVKDDPLKRLRDTLGAQKKECEQIEEQCRREILQAVEDALPGR